MTTGSQVYKLLFCVGALVLSGCGGRDFVTDALDRAPLIYRPQILQGNVFSQEQINKLEPGMSKRQARFVMGSPMLADTFHQDRWDYYYADRVGQELKRTEHVILYFENDSLARIEGDYRPQPAAEREEPKREIAVSVPDYVAPPRTFWERIQRTVTDTVGLRESDGG